MPDDARPPAPRPEGAGLPARRIGSEELEAVIRRAVEIQAAREGAAAAGEGIDEAEAVRIGEELGLAPDAVRRAIVDVRSRVPAERGPMASLMGPGVVRAARVVRRPAAETGMLVERWLTECEFMAVQRRFPDRTRYARAKGVAAGIGRALRQIGERHQSLGLPTVDVAVSAVDEDRCLVELSVDYSGQRAGLAAGGLAGGLGGGGAVAAAAWTAGVEPLMLLGIPVLGALVAGMSAIHRHHVSSTAERMESFLDRLEHGELRLPERGRRSR